MKEFLRQHIEEVVSLTDAEFEFVRSHFTIRQYDKGDLLIPMNGPARHVFLVASGLLKLTYIDQKGREHIVSFALENWWECDYPAWFSGKPASLTLEAIEHSEVYCLTLDGYQAICNGSQKMEHFFLHKANRGHMASQERIISFLTATPRERYEQLLEKQPVLIQRVPKVLLATYLGVSRETLSRLWSKK